jgi:GNAT superfamily N-acetyltransferase
MRLPSRFDPEVSLAIERAAVRGWPAEEVEEVEGWVLRRTEGVGRRRSNSMLPPVEAGVAVRTMEMAFATAEELGFPTTVQVSPAEMHLALDEALEDRGLELGGSTLVLTGALAVRAPSLAVELGRLDDGWVEAWAAVAGEVGAEETAAKVLSQLGENARFAVVREAGEPVAVAVGVVDEAWLGVFSLTVATRALRRGIASAVMDALERWAVERGASGVYLQVETDNAPALALYARRGMVVSHSYHYRG